MILIKANSKELKKQLEILWNEKPYGEAKRVLKENSKNKFEVQKYKVKEVTGTVTVQCNTDFSTSEAYITLYNDKKDKCSLNIPANGQEIRSFLRQNKHLFQKDALITGIKVINIKTGEEKLYYYGKRAELL